MPYIDKKVRKEVDSEIRKIVSKLHKHPEEKWDGILNYVFFKMLLESFGKVRYLDYERMIGILECCKLELYRKRVGPFEDTKIKEHGDIK